MWLSRFRLKIHPGTLFADEMALLGYGGTCFRTSISLVVNKPNKWDVPKHVPPRLP